MTHDSREIDISFIDEKAGRSMEYDAFNVPVSKLYGVGKNAKRRISNRIKKRLEGEGNSRSNQITDDFTAYDAFDVATPPYNLDYLSKLYEVSPYNYAAINAKVANVVGLGYEFVETFATKQALEKTKSANKKRLMRQRIESIKNEMAELVDRLNEEQTFTESIEHAYIDYQAMGVGYLEIGRAANGRIGYVGNIPAATMRVRKKRDGFVQISGSKAVFFRNFGDLETSDPIGDQDDPNEIIQLKNYSPSNSYYGSPDIISAMPAVAGNEFATRYNLDYFEHRASPRYIITLKGAKLSQVAENKLLEFMQSSLKGKNHRSIYIPLPPDDMNNKTEFKMQAVESGVQDSSFDSYRKANRDEILMAHRVPITKIGISDNASVALAKDADKTFKEQVCQPSQKTLAKKINKIIGEFTDVVELKFNELALTDEDTQSRIDERYLRTGVIVPNEVRARKGMPALPDGDKPIDLSPQARAEQVAQATDSRQRDQEREANNPDSGDQARNAKGEGRQQD